MILKVSRLGHPVLRAKAQDVSPDDIRAGIFESLIEDMFETMEAYQGVGLAAPQVHLSIRLFVCEMPERIARRRGAQALPQGVFFNATLEKIGEPTVVDTEGCLSIPFLAGDVARHQKVILRGLDRSGNPVELPMEGYPARILQHEVDHTDGQVYIDRADLTTMGYTVVL